MNDPTTPYRLSREERHLLTRIEALEEAILFMEAERQLATGRLTVAWPHVGPLASVRRFVMKKRARLEMARPDPRPHGSE